MSQCNEAGRVAPRRRISRQHPDQHHRRAHKRVERQLHRRVLPPRRSPDCDQEVLGHDRNLVEHKEQKHVEAEKDPVHPTDQRQEEREKLIRAQLDVPAEQDSSHCREPRQQHQHAADSIGCQQVVNPHRRHPGQIDNRHAGGMIWPHPGHKPLQRQRQASHGHRQRQPTRQRLVAVATRPPFGQQRQHQRPGKREIDRECQ